jgi:MFS family permease
MTSRTRWAAVVAAWATGVIAAAYVGKLPPALPGLKAEFGLSLVAAGWVVSTFNTLATAAGIFVGLAADRAGAFRACAAGLALLALGGLAGALAPSPGWLLASRIVEGMGFVTTTVAAAALIFVASAPDDRRLTLGIWSAYMPFGFALTLLAAPPILGAAGWRGLWIAIVALTVVCGVWLATQRGHYAMPAGGSRSAAGIGAALRQPGPWWIAAAMGCYTAVWTSVMVWLPTFLVQERGATTAGAALATVLAVAVNVPGNLTGAWLINRHFARGTVITIGAIGLGLGSIASLAPWLPDWVRFGACLVLSYVGGVIPAAVMTSPQVYARSGGQVAGLQGLMMQWSNLGQFVGPPSVAAVVSATGGWSAAAWLLGAAALGAVVCARAVARYEGQAHAPAAPGRLPGTG